MYTLNPSKSFLKKLAKLVLKDQDLEAKIEKVLDFLTVDPQSPQLKSHKVITKHSLKAYSSRITGDLRIIWDYNESDILILDLLDIGGHSGSKGVY